MATAHPGLQRRGGRIAWLGHGDRVAFRDIRIKPYFLPMKVHAPGTPDNQPPGGFKALFNGQDLTGWKGLVADPPKRAKMTAEELKAAQVKADEIMRAHWTVKDGALVFDGKGQNLCSLKDYGDFDLFVDWKIPPTADSGIYLRGSPQVQIWDPANQSQWGAGGGQGLRRAVEQPEVRQPAAGQGGPADRRVEHLLHAHGGRAAQRVAERPARVGQRGDGELLGAGQAHLPRGAIELQNHGNTLEFKNIYVRELPR